MFEVHTADSFAEDFAGYEEPRRSSAKAVRTALGEAAPYVGSSYAPAGQRRLLPFVVALHLIALWAVVHFDVVGHRHQAQRLEVKLVPLDIAPPPKVSPPPKQAAAKVATPIVAPSPIVPQPVAVQTPVLSAPAPVPPAPAAVTSAPAAPVMSEAAPIVPPDGLAANLGNPAPRYPIESRRAREEGTVRLRVLISPDGRVEQVTVAKSSGFDRLDDAALQAVRKWRFRPGTQAGTPVEAVGFLSIPFKLTR